MGLEAKKIFVRKDKSESNCFEKSKNKISFTADFGYVLNLAQSHQIMFYTKVMKLA